MILYGAGGHARVILDTLHDLGMEVKGIFDDAPSGDNFLGKPVKKKYDAEAWTQDPIVLTIGDNANRKKIAQVVRHKYASVVARSAHVSGTAQIGFGSMILQNVIVQTYSVIGNHVILNTASQVDHNCVIGDFVHVAPGVVLCGDVSVGEGTLLGAGAVVIPGIRIGKWCTIGAGSVVIRDIPDHAVVAGNPAQNIAKDRK